MQFHIQDMTCGGCVKSVTRVIRSVDPEAGVAADLETRKVEVTSGQPRGPFAAALERAGFPVADG